MSNSRRLVLAVVVVAVLAVLVVRLETVSTRATGARPETSASASLPTPVFRSAPRAPARLGTRQKAVSFQGRHVYADGVQLQVTGIKRGKLSGKFTGDGVKKGAPVQILTIQVWNGTRMPLSLLGASGRLTYGPHAKTARPVNGKGINSLLGMISPGGSKTGTIAFSVPKKHIHEAKLELTVNPHHLPALFAGSLDYSPGVSTVFNDPKGDRVEQLAIIRHINRSIDATPPGATIRIAQYAFDIPSSERKLLAAHKRGVSVQMLIDYHKAWGAMPWQDRVTTKQTKQLIEALGTNKKNKSFVTMCKAACMSSRRSAMHAKFYLFSTVGSSHWVSMVSSANLTNTNSKLSWNNIHTIVGDTKIYVSLTQYFADMIKDKDDPNYYRTTTSGRYKLYFYPHQEKPGTRSVALLDVLDHVACDGAAKGYGTTDGHTLIRLAMYSWDTARLDIANQLWRLHNQGCKVQIILNTGRTSNPVRQTLLKRSMKYDKLAVYDAWLDYNGDGRANLYMHHKTLMINGVWFGRPNTKVTYTGSQNFVGNATRDNNELVLRILDDNIYDQYAQNFEHIRAQRPRLYW